MNLRRFLLLGGGAAATYLALCGLVFVFQRRILFPAPLATTEPRLAGADLLRIGTRPTVALHVPAPTGAPTVFHFHGNGEQLADQTWMASQFRDAGLGFLAVEYPGYGLMRDQPPSEQALFDSADEVVRWAEKALGLGPDRRVFQGQSLGSGVAVEMAARHRARRLALVTPYTSIPDAAARHFPFLPARRLTRDRFDSASKAPRIDVPVLIVHGTADAVVPYAHGEALSKLFPSARLLTFPGAGHGVVHQPAVIGELTAFARTP